MENLNQSSEFTVVVGNGDNQQMINVTPGTINPEMTNYLQKIFDKDSVSVKIHQEPIFEDVTTFIGTTTVTTQKQNTENVLTVTSGEGETLMSVTSKSRTFYLTNLEHTIDFANRFQL